MLSLSVSVLLFLMFVASIYRLKKAADIVHEFDKSDRVC